jgi:hypothetical protein
VKSFAAAGTADKLRRGLVILKLEAAATSAYRTVIIYKLMLSSQV